VGRRDGVPRLRSHTFEVGAVVPRVRAGDVSGCRRLAGRMRVSVAAQRRSKSTRGTHLEIAFSCMLLFDVVMSAHRSERTCLLLMCYFSGSGSLPASVAERIA
jgi:hypothetical protein